jgi:transcriptional regulator with XRE-family HTH domain
VDGLRELGALVRRFRVEAGLSGSELARRAGVPQPSVSRVEAGQRLSDPRIVVRLADALSLDAGPAGQLMALADRAYAVPARQRVDAGVSMVAGQLYRHISAVRLVRSYSCARVPALLRTAEYVSAAGGAATAGEWVRLAGLVQDASRSFVFVVAEGALRTWPDQVPMAAQLARVVALSEWPNVRLGVLPWGAVLPRVPLHDFTVAGDRAVWLETFTAEITLTRADDVAAYAQAFVAFESAAVFGDQARALIAGIAADLARIRPEAIQ